jgi:hypothetical protein
MVKGESDSTYQKLNQRFITLSSNQSKYHKTIEIWEKEGIEKAMMFYYNTYKNAPSYSVVEVIIDSPVKPATLEDLGLNREELAEMFKKFRDEK